MAEDRETLHSCWPTGVAFRGLLVGAAAEHEAAAMTAPTEESVAGIAVMLARVSSAVCGAGEAEELIPVLRGRRFREAADRLKELAAKE